MPGPMVNTQGMCFAFPDVCKTVCGPSVVPIPYPNIGQLATAVGFSTKVFINGMPAVHMNTMIPMTNGDQAGAVGGVMGGIIMGPVKFVQPESKVLIEGIPAVAVGGTTMQNNNNAPGHIMMSQTKVIIS